MTTDPTPKRKRSALDFLNGTTPGWDDTVVVTMDEIPNLEFKARIRVLQPVDILSESKIIEVNMTSESVADAAEMQASERLEREEAKFRDNIKDEKKFKDMLDIAVLRGVVSIFSYDDEDNEVEIPITFDAEAKDHDVENRVYSLSRFKTQHAGALFYWLANKVMQAGGLAAESLEAFPVNSGKLGSAARQNGRKVRTAT